MKKTNKMNWMVGSAAVLLALGAFACSSPAGVPASSSSGGPTDVTPAPAAPAAPSAPDAPKVDATNPIGSGETKSVTIDNSVGGSVELSDGTKLEIPAGALPDGVDTITVTSSTSPVGAEYTAASPLYTFGPEGTVFASPITISFPASVPASLAASDLTVMWSRLGAAGYDMVPTTFTAIGNDKVLATASIHHFSTGFCGVKWSVDPHPSVDPYQE